LINPLLARLIE